MLENWLEDSGWTSALTQGDIASSGRADTFIKAIHVTKTRHTHEITAASLYILLQQAYDVFSTSAISVQTLNPGTATTFQDYADSMFERFVSSQIANASRVDVVWDAYLPGSLKATIRKKRGKSVRGRVFPSNDMPKNWKGFLRDDNNKTELFTFLAQQVIGITVEESKVILQLQNEMFCAHRAKQTLAMFHHARRRRPMHASYSTQQMQGCREKARYLFAQ